MSQGLVNIFMDRVAKILFVIAFTAVGSKGVLCPKSNIMLTKVA